MSEQNNRNTAGLRRAGAIVLLLGALPILFSSFSATGPASNPLPQGVNEADWVIPGEISIQLKAGSGDAELSALSRLTGIALQWNSPLSRSGTEVADGVVTSGAGASISQILARLRSDPRVEAADVTHIYRVPQGEMQRAVAEAPPMPARSATGSKWKPNDPRYGEQWNFQLIDAEGAWEQTHGKGTVVAVIDTGVAYKDTDQGKQSRDFGSTQFVPGYDFVHRNAVPYDDNGHGTHVAGTISESTDNGEGVAGLAFESKIMPLKVLTGYGSGSSRDIAEAIRWAADHGANVINMSLGSPFPDSLIGSACRYAYQKGVTIVCAAGNSGKEGVGYPAAFKECIAVSSVGPGGELSYFSSWGKQVAISAPGGDKNAGGESGGILQNTVLPDDNGALVDGYYAFQGTSMASPHVAAAAAMVYSRGIHRPEDVRAVLLKSARSKGPVKKYGAGILNVSDAVRLAGRSYGDAVSRFWMVAGLFLFAGLLGRATKKSSYAPGGSPFWCAASVAFGLLFPDWVAGYAGAGSLWNLVGHSVLVPAALLTMGANGNERRLLGWMSAGLMAHFGWVIMRGTAPFSSTIGIAELLPWAASNFIVGFGLIVSALAAPRDSFSRRH